MIKSIDIENFRCFHKTKIDGFKRINLIGGQNNGGKTSLLEAIQLGCWPSGQVLNGLQYGVRLFDKGILAVEPKRYWLNLFYELKEQTISISVFDDTKGLGHAQIAFDNVSDEVITTSFNQNTIGVPSSKLKTKFYWEGQTARNYSMASANSDGTIQAQNGPGLKKIRFIPATGWLNQNELVYYFDLMKSKDEPSFFLDIFKLIDESIESIETYNLGTANMYLRSKGRLPMPIQAYGDAIGRMANIIANLISRQYEGILIDEIENGIHYSNQKALWNMLYKIAVKLDIQVFTTTHSREMANALTEAANEYSFTDEAAYFELFKHPKTGEIEANQMDMDLLKYKLQYDKEFRG